MSCPGGLRVVRSHAPFFFIAAAPTAIYTLSLHDALPDLVDAEPPAFAALDHRRRAARDRAPRRDRKSTRLNSSHVSTSYAVFCLKKKSPWSTALCVPTQS